MKQRHIFLSFLSIGAPWAVMLIKDDPLMALITLALQASVIGWLPASVWAWRAVHNPSIQNPQPHATHDTKIDKTVTKRFNNEN